MALLAPSFTKGVPASELLTVLTLGDLLTRCGNVTEEGGLGEKSSLKSPGAAFSGHPGPALRGINDSPVGGSLRNGGVGAGAILKLEGGLTSLCRDRVSQAPKLLPADVGRACEVSAMAFPPGP